MAEVKPGDVVQLKSGGPAMTVSKVEGDICHCAWFIGSDLKHGMFSAATLEPYEAPSVKFI
ncbi:YodC family protein [Alkalilacustris brevis]|uniref:YodC family protein n=1 Tax=Alkalilacustris brevis TaxID=2026338 RepID=UPI00192E595F|nr:DUF2158 domain-containing protein [Alkalilacustris brevis]